MSHKATVWAWEMQKTGRVPNANSLLVLLKIADMTRDSGRLWASHVYIAREVGLSSRTVFGAIKALVESDLLRLDKRPGTSDELVLLLTPVTIYQDGAEEDGELQVGKGRGRPSGSKEKTTANPAPGNLTTAKTTAKTTARPATDTVDTEDTLDSADAGASDLDFLFGDDDPEEAPKPAAEPAKPARDPFETFWAIFPKRLGKKEAKAAWPKALAIVAAETDQHPATFLIQKAQALAEHLGDEPHFAAKPERWLRQELWNDDLIPRRQPSGAPIDRRRVIADQRTDDMLAGAVEALNRRRGLAGSGSADGH